MRNKYSTLIAAMKAALSVQPHPGRLLQLVLVATVWSSCAGSSCPRAAASDELFAPPPVVAVQPAPVTDEVLLISTREIGTICNGQSMREGLICRRLSSAPLGRSQWLDVDCQAITQTVPSPTIVYVHGNRVGPGRDIADGMAVYRSLKRHSPQLGPVRFIIFSWPASQIPGPIKDYLVKAQRTTPVAWQLAWLLDKFPTETPIALVGYSYGTRVVSGASHLLAGGNLGPLKLEDRVHPARPLLRAALIAAAYDADWVQPDEFYSRTITQTERLIVGTNKLDPAMRFYHLSNGRGRMHALGRSGPDQSATLGALTRRLRRVDFSRSVGRSHALADYLAAENSMSELWHQLLMSHDRNLLVGQVQLKTSQEHAH